MYRSPCICSFFAESQARKVLSDLWNISSGPLFASRELCQRALESISGALRCALCTIASLPRVVSTASWQLVRSAFTTVISLSGACLSPFSAAAVPLLRLFYTVVFAAKNGSQQLLLSLCLRNIARTIVALYRVAKHFWRNITSHEYTGSAATPACSYAAWAMYHSVA